MFDPLKANRYALQTGRHEFWDTLDIQGSKDKFATFSIRSPDSGMADKLNAQINVKMPKELLATLRAIEARHGISPADALRRLGECMANFYEEHGWFAFPASVYPHMDNTPAQIVVWKLDARCKYHLNDFEVVRDLLQQLGIWSSITAALAKTADHISTAFSNHPTHWLWIYVRMDANLEREGSLTLEAYPKSKFTRAQFEALLTEGGRTNDAGAPVLLTLPVIKPPAGVTKSTTPSKPSTRSNQTTPKARAT